MLQPPTQSPTLRETFGPEPSTTLIVPLVPPDSRVVLEVTDPIPGFEWVPVGAFVVTDPQGENAGHVVVDLTASGLSEILSHRSRLASTLSLPPSSERPRPQLPVSP